MNQTETATEQLFSYGTLQIEAVQLATFGRRLAGQPDTLVGYRQVMIQIQDQDFVAKHGDQPQRNLHFTGKASDCVEGTVLALTKQELAQADAYEPVEYKRVRVQTKSGLHVWLYVSSEA